MKQTTIGFALTGSFCTFEKALLQIEELVRRGYDVVPVLSFNAGSLDTRFMTAQSLRVFLQTTLLQSFMQQLVHHDFTPLILVRYTMLCLITPSSVMMPAMVSIQQRLWESETTIAV